MNVVLWTARASGSPRWAIGLVGYEFFCSTCVCDPIETRSEMAAPQELTPTGEENVFSPPADVLPIGIDSSGMIQFYAHTAPGGRPWESLFTPECAALAGDHATLANSWIPLTGT